MKYYRGDDDHHGHARGPDEATQPFQPVCDRADPIRGHQDASQLLPTDDKFDLPRFGIRLVNQMTTSTSGACSAADRVAARPSATRSAARVPFIPNKADEYNRAFHITQRYQIKSNQNKV